MKKETIRSLLILVMSFLLPLTFGIVIGGFLSSINTLQL